MQRRFNMDIKKILEIRNNALKKCQGMIKPMVITDKNDKVDNLLKRIEKLELKK